MKFLTESLHLNKRITNKTRNFDSKDAINLFETIKPYWGRNLEKHEQHRDFDLDLFKCELVES